MLNNNLLVLNPILKEFETHGINSARVVCKFVEPTLKRLLFSLGCNLVNANFLFVQNRSILHCIEETNKVCR
jgi:hypothetical protein